MDGVANMRARLEKLGGRFEFSSKAGEGTIVRFDLPFL
jgi:signal transduction histidine kinase